MMNYAIIENGVIVNIAVADKPFGSNWVLASDKAFMGGTWDGQSFQPPARPLVTAEEARTTRNTLLAASDWTQVADAPVDQAAWATYRQALRDITAQAGFPESINWPLSP
jgi:hypothetical protein